MEELYSVPENRHEEWRFVTRYAQRLSCTMTGANKQV